MENFYSEDFSDKENEKDEGEANQLDALFGN